ncbi:MAG: hypothetical protein K2J77_12545 [Oscillospiraceae bacterium]|nr:hypothetical protein [Oscillospiraceae bacterium]
MSEKYGKSFTVAELGDRIDRDTATAYVYADDDPSMRFVVRTDKSGEVIYEEYPYRLMCRKVENKINETFAKYGIVSECFVTFTPRRNINVSPNMTFDEFVKVNTLETAITDIVVLSDVDLTGEKIVNVYTEICDYLENVDFGTCIYVLTESDFNKIKEKIRHEVETFALQDLKYSGASDNINELFIKVEDKKMPLTSSEIDSELGRE